MKDVESHGDLSTSMGESHARSFYSTSSSLNYEARGSRKHIPVRWTTAAILQANEKIEEIERKNQRKVQEFMENGLDKTAFDSWKKTQELQDRFEVDRERLRKKKEIWQIAERIVDRKNQIDKERKKQISFYKNTLERCLARKEKNLQAEKAGKKKHIEEMKANKTDERWQSILRERKESTEKMKKELNEQWTQHEKLKEAELENLKRAVQCRKVNREKAIAPQSPVEFSPLPQKFIGKTDKELLDERMAALNEEKRQRILEEKNAKNATIHQKFERILRDYGEKNQILMEEKKRELDIEHQILRERERERYEKLLLGAQKLETKKQRHSEERKRQKEEWEQNLLRMKFMELSSSHLEKKKRQQKILATQRHDAYLSQQGLV